MGDFGCMIGAVTGVSCIQVLLSDFVSGTFLNIFPENIANSDVHTEICVKYYGVIHCCLLGPIMEELVYSIPYASDSIIFKFIPHVLSRRVESVLPPLTFLSNHLFPGKHSQFNFLARIISGIIFCLRHSVENSPLEAVRCLIIHGPFYFGSWFFSDLLGKKFKSRALKICYPIISHIFSNVVSFARLYSSGSLA